MYQKYKKDVAFFVVYIREAHPTDGRTSRKNDRDGIKVKSPKTLEEREEVASECSQSMDLSIPFLIDNMKNEVGAAWAGWPDRIYIVGKDGKVSYQGGPGPWGFDPVEAERKLKTLLK